MCNNVTVSRYQFRWNACEAQEFSTWPSGGRQRQRTLIEHVLNVQQKKSVNQFQRANNPNFADSP